MLPVFVAANCVPGAAERHATDARGSGPRKGVMLVQSPFTLTAWQWPDTLQTTSQALAKRKSLTVPLECVGWCVQHGINEAMRRRGVGNYDECLTTTLVDCCLAHLLSCACGEGMNMTCCCWQEEAVTF